MAGTEKTPATKYKERNADEMIIKLINRLIKILKYFELPDEVITEILKYITEE